jgi:outer membrane protein assembly factor BamB
MLPLAFLVVSVVLPAGAADYPQWRGPDRSGVSPDTGLLKEWPKGGPVLLWKQQNIGNGYSTPAVAGGRIYLVSDRQKEEFAIALDEKDGKEIWSVRLGKVGPNMGPQYPGSRSTPTVEGDVLYALGSDGDLACLETATGKIRWRKSYRGDFQGKPGMWAYSESVLIDGDALIGTPGGTEATMVALNKKTGEVLWKSAIPGGEQAAYASVIVGEVGAVKQYIQFLQKGVVGVDARTGRFLWRYNKTSDPAANIPTPLFYNGFVFSGTSRDGGSGLVKLTAEKEGVTATEVYRAVDKKVSLGGFVRVGDYLYTTTTAGLLCLEFATGKEVWKDRCVGSGALCYAEGHLYVRGDAGPTALVEATPAGYKEKGRLTQPDRSKQPAWPYPVVANGRLYLRDQNVLLCYDIKDRAGN